MKDYERQDVRDTATFKEALSIYSKARNPGGGVPFDAVDVQVAPDGREAVLVGVWAEDSEGLTASRLCRIELATAQMNVISWGPGTDRHPRWSPDQTRIAFLSDRRERGNFQLCLLDLATAMVSAAPTVEGWIETLHWAPDGRRILLGVAGHGADLSGAEGAIQSPRRTQMPEWMPSIDLRDDPVRFRSVWLYDLADGSTIRIGPRHFNFWELTWCGTDTFAAVVSRAPDEGAWYGATLERFEIGSDRHEPLHATPDQLGRPIASPSGSRLAVIEAVCSDRYLVAGDLKLLSAATGGVHQVDVGGVDVSYLEWRDENHLLISGHRGLESVVGLYDAAADHYEETWSSRDITGGGIYLTVSGIGVSGDCAFIAESFNRAPELALIRNGRYQTLCSFALPVSEKHFEGRATPIQWAARDGLTIQGWLLEPSTPAPHPMIMAVHGGPVWHWRPMWLGRRSAAWLMLLARGYAIFLPNPRGSSGRGQPFARHVVGDMGGEDTHDLLTGIDHLIQEGVADSHRLGVTGGSYGGFMSSWLIAQDDRFSAAVPFVPVNNWVTQELLSNIPDWVSRFLAEPYDTPQGKHIERSPVMQVRKIKTPVLQLCGALDRSAPPEEAVQFHQALLAQEVESVLITYPQEGHGVRRLPTSADFAARVVSWFEEHM